MKNKRVRFDDKFYFTLLDILLLVGSLLLLVANINWPIWGYIILIILLLFCLSGLYIFPRMGLYFNYTLGIIKYLGPHNVKKRVINMDEIAKIDFNEILVPKEKGVTPKSYVANNETVNNIYKKGKIFKFNIYLINGDIIEIPYYNLFKTKSKKRVAKQEKRITNIVTEFNSFKTNGNHGDGSLIDKH